jgi:glutamyl-tRNA synthetase
MTIRTRFAPSPTGFLHIGGVRTALFSWLYARHHGGQFLLRIEDTDRERSTDDAVNIILEGMQWLELDYDEGPHFQTRRFSRYKEVMQQLLDEDKAYHCYCSKEQLEEMRAVAMARGDKPKYNGRCRDRQTPPPGDIKPVVRFKTPLQGETVIEDLIQGTVRYQNRELDDLIIARPDGTPTYNLTVVVDDFDMGITHVIRGDDHLNNTPRQLNIFQALGQAPPVYAHVPMILGPDGKKLSKRDTNTLSVLHYREQGILPEALLNYLVRLGWSHGDQEIFSRGQMIDLFDVADVNKAAAALNPDKLIWLNQHYIKHGNSERLAGLLQTYLHEQGFAGSVGPAVPELLDVQKERCKTLKEMAEQSRYFFHDFDNYEETAAKKQLRPEVLDALTRLHIRLEQISDWNKGSIHQAIDEVAGEAGLKLGKVAQPLRVAVTGGAVSPAIDDTLYLLGKDRTLVRLNRALEYIRSRGAT